MARITQVSGWDIAASTEEMQAIRIALQYASLGSSPGNVPAALSVTADVHNTMNELLNSLAVLGPAPIL
jgi:hypothetical protein